MRHWALHAARNTALAVVAEVLARVANTIFFILLTWYLGEAEASSYTLGFMFASFLIQLSLGGIDQLLTREVAKAPERGGAVLGTFLLARLISSTLLYIGLIFWILGPFGYDGVTNQVVLVIGATLIPDSLIVLCQGFLIARDRVQYVTLLGALTGALKLGFGILALWLGGGARAAAVVVLGASVLALVLHLGLIITRFTSLSLSLDRAFLVASARAEAPLLLIAMLTTVEGTLDALLLSRRVGTLEVGVYAASTLFLNALMIVPIAFRQVILPPMTAWYQSQRERAFDVYTQSARMLLIAGLFISASLTVAADQLIPLLYRNNFSETIPVLRILIWSFVCTTFLVPCGRLMLAAGKQAAFVPILSGSLVLNISLNLLLQPDLGAEGAAIARVASAMLTVILSIAYVQRTLYRWKVFSAVSGPLGAVVLLLLVGFGLRWLGIHWIGALLAGWLIYAGSLVMLRAVSAAELRRLRELLRQRAAPLTPP